MPTAKPPTLSVTSPPRAATSDSGLEKKQPRPKSGPLGRGYSPRRGTITLSASGAVRSSTGGEIVTKDRVVAYIDGYNLYYGLRQADLRTSRWLDLRALCGSILQPDQHLVQVRYFTTRVRNDPDSSARQSLYIDALTARSGITIDFGHFLSKEVVCRNCGNVHVKNEEKKTDVNIAVRMLDDAYDDRFDVATLISGDSDLAPPIQSVRSRFPTKRVVVAFPPRRNSAELRRTANSWFQVSEASVRSSRLPNPVVGPGGIQIRAPRGWLPSGRPGP